MLQSLAKNLLHVQYILNSFCCPYLTPFNRKFVLIPMQECKMKIVSKEWCELGLSFLQPACGRIQVTKRKKESCLHTKEGMALPHWKSPKKPLLIPKGEDGRKFGQAHLHAHLRDPFGTHLVAPHISSHVSITKTEIQARHSTIRHLL